MSQEKENILVSACLLGINCRYDGKNGKNEQVMELMETYNLIPVCPEQLGGMQTPREPAERSDTRVVNKAGQDVTLEFQKGGRETLKLGQIYGCKKAVFKERSPSCGHGIIYDGSFTGKKIPGSGVAAVLLEENGIEVIGESMIEEHFKNPDKG